ncbi:MAG: hypothetical protein EHM54_05815 [Nitrospiraceae bacterium]|nr:MAG: hypothetical protein EHM54_05815 [Nitrospiraceae bacterium]
MHNSQNGTSVAIGGSGVGWGGSGDLTGGSPQATPNNTLLVTTCVGCHTSTTSSTIINLGSNRIPIVYNTVLPTTPLAGGNFYWVAQGDDTKGHNVYGIAGQDANLSEAPGRNTSATCAGTCHYTLADPPEPGLFPGNMDRGGCQGCHVFTAHHDDSKPWYRFLKGHNDWTPTAESFGDYVTGIEDTDWESTKSATDHNYYKGSTVAYNSDGTGLLNQKTVSSFCAGCHSIFHNTANISSYPGGVPYASPWLRHPTDIQLPTTSGSEYEAYDPVTNYSTEAPVAWVNPDTPVRAEAVVMCLSCHRPHGSPYPDMLRWDYSTIIAGGGGSGGCFTCHTNKN